MPSCCELFIGQSFEFFLDWKVVVMQVIVTITLSNKSLERHLVSLNILCPTEVWLGKIAVISLKVEPVVGIFPVSKGMGEAGATKSANWGRSGVNLFGAGDSFLSLTLF